MSRSTLIRTSLFSGFAFLVATGFAGGETSRTQGKPENVIEKIVEGKMKKFYSEACLLEQPYVKNPDITVQDLLNEMMAKTGENILIRRYARFQLGETDERQGCDGYIAAAILREGAQNPRARGV